MNAFKKCIATAILLMSGIPCLYAWPHGNLNYRPQTFEEFKQAYSTFTGKYNQWRLGDRISVKNNVLVIDLHYLAAKEARTLHDDLLYLHSQGKLEPYNKQIEFVSGISRESEDVRDGLAPMQSIISEKYGNYDKKVKVKKLMSELASKNSLFTFSKTQPASKPDLFFRTPEHWLSLYW